MYLIVQELKSGLSIAYVSERMRARKQLLKEARKVGQPKDCTDQEIESRRYENVEGEGHSYT
ncbi:hypothetical protein CCR75_002434 [Bremia lactucae]|uniref:Uncharacterized protein n=1 Tax=Bremia lactucae TaxID=4779 RepID=A0A976ICF4_BRELC|nr:hypothetical protein CCR75_002434 [Bremia lactucae]